MKKYWLLVLAAVLMTACKDYDTPSLPDEPDEEVVPLSSKDHLPWPISEYMDLTVRPGDNFYMYCNGTYWNNTEVDKEHVIKGLTSTEMSEALNKMIANHRDPAFTQLKAMLAQPLSNDEFYAFLKPFYDRINKIQSYEDAFALAGQLKTEGVKSFFNLVLTQRKMVKAVIRANNTKYFKPYYEPFLTDDHPDYVYGHTTPPTEYNEDEVENPDIELTERAEELVKKYILPDIGLSDEYCASSDTFDEWLSMPIDELKAFFKMIVFRDFAALTNTQGLAYMEEPSDSEGTDAANWIDYQLKDLKEYLDSRAMIEQYITPQLKTEVKNMCEELRQVFIQRIDSRGWMSSSTKAHAIRKIERIKFFVGGPDKWIADSPELNGCANTLEAMQVFYRSELDYLKAFMGMKEEDDFFHFNLTSSMDLLTINCSYEQLTNSIVIFPPFMLPPVYEANMHPAMKYGMLMSSIGHEITHSVDASGARIDENGEHTAWWTIQDNMDYEKLQQQLVEQYNRLAVLPDFSSAIFNNGERTLDENIADLGGTEVSHEAFVNYCKKQGFYGEDLDEMERKFFHAYANMYRAKYGYDFYLWYKNDEHAFEKERVNGVVMNMDRWYELFNVQWGDFLYLKSENRTHIW